MIDALSDEWIDAAIEASRHRASGRSGTVAMTIGKKTVAVLEIADGRVVASGGSDVERAGVTIPVTGAQLSSLIDGSESLAMAFMRGDVKPAGATGPLLAAVELFEDETFRSRLAELL